MKFFLLCVLLSTALAALAYPAAEVHANKKKATTWPHGPFNTKGADIVNSNGDKLIFVGTNWPASGESMIPEGLEHQSLDSIVGKLKDAGFNFVRHTYAIQMIDEIYENGGKDITIEHSLIQALGQENGTKVLNQMVEKNPQWNAKTTRLELLKDVAAAEASAGILMHLDNHISEAMWCCGGEDQSGWFGDVKFDVTKWHRGLAYMANWAKGIKNIETISLRNELRYSRTNPSLEYSWVNWWNHVRDAAEIVHAANPDLVITLSGVDYDIDLSAVTMQSDLRSAPSTDSNLTKSADAGDKPIIADIKGTKFGKANKAVLELHAYKQSDFYSTPAYLEDCPLLQASFYRHGFNAIGMPPPEACKSDKWEEPYGCPEAKIQLPVLLTEFGDAIDSNYKNVTLQKCLRDWTTKNKIGWAQWALAGSYRIRQGIQDFEDTWGLTTRDWSAWRSDDAMDNFFKPWIKDMGKTNLEL